MRTAALDQMSGALCDHVLGQRRLRQPAGRGGAAEPVRRPAGPARRVVPLPPPGRRNAAVRTAKTRTRRGVAGAPARRRLVRGAGPAREGDRARARGWRHPRGGPADQPARAGLRRRRSASDRPPMAGRPGRGRPGQLSAAGDHRGVDAGAHRRRAGRAAVPACRGARIVRWSTSGRQQLARLRHHGPACVLGSLGSRPDAAGRARRPRRVEPPGSPWFPAAMATLGIAHALTGAADVAVKELDLAARLGADGSNCRHAAVAALAELSLLAAERDDWPDAEEKAGQAVDLIETAGMEEHLFSILGYVAAARVAAHQGNQVAARRHAGTVLRMYTTPVTGGDPVVVGPGGDHARRDLPRPGRLRRRPLPGGGGPRASGRTADRRSAPRATAPGLGRPRPRRAGTSGSRARWR